MICGPRDCEDWDMLEEAIEESGFDITMVISGGATGVDSMAVEWAKQKGIPYKIFPADWKNLNAHGAVIRMGQYGEYNAMAGLDRNVKMAKYANTKCKDGGGLIAIDIDANWTCDIVKTGYDNGLKVYVYKPGVPEGYDYIF